MVLVCIGLSFCTLINSLMWVYLAYSDIPKTGREVSNLLAFSQLWPCLFLVSLKASPCVICMQGYKNSSKPTSGFYRERGNTVRFGRPHITMAENSLKSIANVQRRSHQQCQMGYSSSPQHFCLTSVLNTFQSQTQTSLMSGSPYLPSQLYLGGSSFLPWRPPR